ncbi:CapA family protein [Shouchella miscanthi]|uniref:CapA family protein n=1 Tax=Shouchella miscanthi TaxID=2598861 RepID=A0ABU6NFX1_9BACI|nr:CapA family protein [Shouchella miscanthi]
MKRATATFGLLMLLASGCQSEVEATAKDVLFLEGMKQQERMERSVDSNRFQLTATICAVGDILIHDRVYDDARVEGGFDFSPMFDNVAPYLQAADVTIANQETMIGGEALGLSGYPAFNSPFEVGDALKEAGVNVVTLANNHTLDRGPQSILNALDYWDELNMTYTGAFRNKEDAKDLRIIESQGISIAILSYTYGTNGIPVPNGRDYLVNFAEASFMAEQIREADKEADAVLVALHAGEEYVDFPNQQQRDLVQLAADSGATAVIGHHPHVLQPIEWVEGKHDHDMLVVYSLGNFLSGQYDHPRRVGGIFTFDLQKLTGKKAQAINPSLMPTYVQFDEGDHNYQVTPMKDLTDYDLPDVEKHLDDVEAHMSQWLPELTVTRE